MKPLNSYAALFKALYLSICEKAELHSEIPLERILKNPKLIVAINHATPLSWIPAVTFLTTKAVEAGGGDKVTFGVIDRVFFSNPLTKPIAEYITQSDHPRGFNELKGHFESLDRANLVVFPEGARTFFGDLSQIQEFRSPRFIELSIRTQTPILLAVHKGSENWNLPLQLPREWGAFLMPFAPFFGKNILNFGALNIPLRLHKIPRFSMQLHLYMPSLYESDLAENEHERRHQLNEEGEKIRALMQEMWEKLPT